LAMAFTVNRRDFAWLMSKTSQGMADEVSRLAENWEISSFSTLIFAEPKSAGARIRTNF
jgi:hypothetical protein